MAVVSRRDCQRARKEPGPGVGVTFGGGCDGCDWSKGLSWRGDLSDPGAGEAERDEGREAVPVRIRDMGDGA